ncbi:MAG: DUF1257 domain-containing protein [Cyanobacteriota bacterium]|jgi:hypothetical protein
MSHFTTLPTVLRDTDLLVSALEALGLHPERDGLLRGFGGEEHPVAVAIRLADGTGLGWRHDAVGHLVLVGDLARLSQSRELSGLLGAITRAYAAHLALREAATHLPGAVVRVLC